MKRIICWLVTMIMISAAGGLPAQAEEALRSTLYVKKIEDLPDDFILGMDVSSVIALEKSGVVYRNAAGEVQDLFGILADAGINLIRVRVWNDPYDAGGNGYGGGNNDLAAAAEIGRRAAEHGMKLMVDFHYSDFWADPGKQMVPKAWKGMEVEEKAEALYAYTLESLNTLRERGAQVAMVQIGNETNGLFCGEKIWMNIVWHLMKAGCRAVRDFDPTVKSVIHFANPENTETFLNWVSKLKYYELDYDVLGISYYPWWHGSLENLSHVMRTIRETYGKDVMVAETSYAWTLADSDFFGNTIGEGGVYAKPYAITQQGQANAVRAVADTVKEAGGLGICYWEGAWISVGTESWEKNQEKWERCGSGWASSFAKEYDPKDAGKYYGGSAVDNQTFFDAEGKALESLKVFRLIREGNELPLAADVLEDALVTADVGKTVQLPETVWAVMNDGSRAEVPVTWTIPEEGLDTSREKTLTLEGTADGRSVSCQVKVTRMNYAGNPSFEEEDLSMWRCQDLSGADQLYCEEKTADSLTGNRHWHFYSSGAGTVRFTLEQDLTLEGGDYEYMISIMGGDAGNQEIYSYVKVNGETVSRTPAAITSWNSWDTPKIAFSVEPGQQVTCGIFVRCDGPGAWGKIDDMTVVSAEGK